MELPALDTPRLEIGSQGRDFKHNGTDGRKYSLSSFRARFLVLIFMSNGCPTVKAYEERLLNMQYNYGPKGIQLVGINSNNDHLSAIDSFVEMVNRAKVLNFPYLKDPD